MSQRILRDQTMKSDDVNACDLCCGDCSQTGCEAYGRKMSEEDFVVSRNYLTRGRPKVNCVLLLVSQLSGIPTSQIISPSRVDAVKRARHLLWATLRFGGYSYSDIGRQTGFDHSSVLNALRPGICDRHADCVRGLGHSGDALPVEAPYEVWWAVKKAHQDGAQCEACQ